VVDRSATIVFATEALESLLGYPAEELLGQPFGSILAVPEEGEGLLSRGGNTCARTNTDRLVDVSIDVSESAGAGAAGFAKLLEISGATHDEPVITDLEEQLARDRIELLHTIMGSLGYSLDAEQTCDVVVSALVPDFADFAALDVSIAVFTGDPLPSLKYGPWPVRNRTAAARAAAGIHIDVEARERALSNTPQTPRTHRLRMGEAMLTTDVRPVVEGSTVQARFFQTIYPRETRSAIVAPLFVKDGLLGVLNMSRRAEAVPFDEDDLKLVQDILPKVSLNLNNVWRYAHEYRTALSLQQSLLPRTFTTTPSSEVGGTYVAADPGSGISGDWYDAIPLSSFRTAFVVGDVVGHGLSATAMMGRLRTAVQSIADLDLDPEEVLSRLDEFVQRIADEGGAAGERAFDGVTGSTCLYAVYDPVRRSCLMASAGHPPPLVIGPDGAARFMDLDPGPPLGVGGMPFEIAEVDVPPGSVIAFYTDGLMGRDVSGGPERFRSELERALSTSAHLQEISRDVVAAMLPSTPEDDAALLLVRTKALPPSDTARWSLATDESVVARARSLVSGQLSSWGMDEFVFTAEIVASELVTNAIRHASGAIEMSLLHGDGVVVCEVSDESNTQPRMRRARSTDENGRGLFIIAQVAKRWGSRYGRNGKTIWVELVKPAF